MLWVSVPWRGLRSFGLDRSRHSHIRGLVFPSPGGDYGLWDLSVAKAMVAGRRSFRPLAGITVFGTIGF